MRIRPRFRRLTVAEWAFDLALAVAALLLSLLFVGATGNPLADVVVVVITMSGVALRRSSPPVALALVALGAVVQMATLGVPNMVNIGQLLAVYGCAAFGTRTVRRVSLVVALTGALVATVYVRLVSMRFEAPPQPLEDLVFTVAVGVLMVAVLGCAWLLGLARYLVLRARQAAVAQRIAEVEAERDRERVAVELERGRVAREMHDVLAHSLVSIAMLADGTRVSVRANPAEAEDLARTIGDVARESVTDVRRLLAELRHGQAEGAAPTIADLHELVGRFEGLGLSVDLRERGEPMTLTPGASLAAYRTVQESLTNALRHGDARTPAVLELGWRGGSLHVCIRNRVRADGASPPNGSRAIPSGGHGLIGIRERVLLEAGTFEVRRERDEFVVEVALPTGTDASLAQLAPAASAPAPPAAPPHPRPNREDPA